MLVSIQEHYQCDPDDLSYLEIAGLNAVLEKNLRITGEEDPLLPKPVRAHRIYSKSGASIQRPACDPRWGLRLPGEYGGRCPV